MLKLRWHPAFVLMRPFRVISTWPWNEMTVVVSVGLYYPREWLTILLMRMLMMTGNIALR